MKKRLIFLSAFAFFMLAGLFAKADGIVIDGSFTDWTAIPHLHTNNQGSSSRYTSLKAFGDADNIYFYIEGNTEISPGIIDFYIDVDNNPNTGFISDQYVAGSGADILYEGGLTGGTIYNHNGPGNGWSWTPSATATYANSLSFSPIVDLSGKKAYEFSIKKSALGIMNTYVNFAINDGNQGTIPENNLNDSKFIRIPVTGTLPVKLISFNASNMALGVKLSWSTATEKNNSHFDLYRSADGSTFEKIGTITGLVNSNSKRSYSYTDNRPLPGLSYYQLKQTDFNGTTEVLDIIEYRSETKQTEFVFYKMSGQDLVELRIYSDTITGSLFQLSDLSGKILLSRQINLVAGDQSMILPFRASAGISIATLSTPSNFIVHKIMMEQ
ncbi:hypothetical protein [Desertivirga xinjiangensis]|uniref:hypothetical protein n=1 Tax=Desertivirga xinjiangensis TaxID=539206 RepID=UPI00210A9FD6|nr:hypothetical protein [Pedobacter xinjiangensis]